MDLKFTEIMGHKIRYAEAGNGENYLLLVHGLGGSAESWIHNIEFFANSSHVFAPDLLGFGRSDKPKMKYDMKLFTRFLDAFLEHLKIKKTDLIGSSLGGQVSAEFAISDPAKIRNLVLISPAGVPPKEFKGTQQLKMYAKMLDAKSISQVRKSLIAMNKGGRSVPLSDEYVRNVYEYIRMPGTKHAFLSALKESGKAPRLSSRLKSIKSDTLVIWGKEDHIIPVKYCQPFISSMPNSRLILLEKCGHRPHAEIPDLFNRLVADFLQEKSTE